MDDCMAPVTSIVFFVLPHNTLHTLTPFNYPICASLTKCRESSTTYLSWNEVQMDTLISNQGEWSGIVGVHLPVSLPAVVPLFNLPVDELTGG